MRTREELIEAMIDHLPAIVGISAIVGLIGFVLWVVFVFA